MIFICLKNSFGQQMNAIAHALNAYENLYPNQQMYVLKDLYYTHIHYNYMYSSILSRYIKIKNVPYIDESTDLRKNHPVLEELFSNDIERQNTVFRTVFYDNKNEDMVIANEWYHNKKEFMLDGNPMYSIFSNDLTPIKKLIYLSKNIVFCNLQDYYNNRINDIEDRHGIFLRFTDDSYWNTYKDSEIREVLNYMQNIKNDKLYIYCDSYYLYNRYKIDEYIDKSNDVIVEMDTKEIPQFDHDFLERNRNIEEEIQFQETLFQVCYNMAHCKSFKGVYPSKLVNLFIPLLRIKLREAVNND